MHQTSLPLLPVELTKVAVLAAVIEAESRGWAKWVDHLLWTVANHASVRLAQRLHHTLHARQAGI